MYMLVILGNIIKVRLTLSRGGRRINYFTLLRQRWGYNGIWTGVGKREESEGAICSGNNNNIKNQHQTPPTSSRW